MSLTNVTNQYPQAICPNSHCNSDRVIIYTDLDEDFGDWVQTSCLICGLDYIYDQNEGILWTVTRFPIKPKIKEGRQVKWPSSCGYCIWCGKELLSRKELPKGVKRHYSEYFCPKTKCSQLYNENFTWVLLREQILLRDNNTCCKCGYFYPLQSKWTYYRFPQLELEIQKSTNPNLWSKFSNLTKSICNAVWGMDHFPKLEVDHIIPVALDGEYWNKDNLWTLCEICHNEKTKHDMKKIKLKKKLGLVPQQTNLLEILERSIEG